MIGKGEILVIDDFIDLHSYFLLFPAVCCGLLLFVVVSCCLLFLSVCLAVFIFLHSCISGELLCFAELCNFHAQRDLFPGATHQRISSLRSMSIVIDNS